MFWTSTQYVGQSMGHTGGYFMFNLTDGHIKVTAGPNWAMYVRGPTSYGINDFVDNGDLTITDRATGLMWSKNDSGTVMDWKTAIDTRFFNITPVAVTQYPYFWSSTTHGDSTATAIYVCFGLAGSIYTATNGTELHGAGALRSDIKEGNPADYAAKGLASDLVVIYNYVRLVRNQ